MGYFQPKCMAALRCPVPQFCAHFQVWNYMSNQCVKQMSVCGEGGAEGGGVRDGEEVTGIIHLVNKFLTVGWNRRIATFPDVPDVRGVMREGE